MLFNCVLFLREKVYLYLYEKGACGTRNVNVSEVEQIVLNSLALGIQPNPHITNHRVYRTAAKFHRMNFRYTKRFTYRITYTPNYFVIAFMFYYTGSSIIQLVSEVTDNSQ